MNRSLLTLLLGLSVFVASAQINSEDETWEVEAVTNEILDIISGTSDDAYNWVVFQSHFTPQAGLAGMFPADSGILTLREMKVVEWITRAGHWYETNDFVEEATKTEVVRTGNIAQVWQHYNTYNSNGDTLTSGVNTYHLLKTEDGWKVAHLMWDDQSPEAN